MWDNNNLVLRHPVTSSAGYSLLSWLALSCLLSAVACSEAGPPPPKRPARSPAPTATAASAPAPSEEAARLEADARRLLRAGEIDRASEAAEASLRLRVRSVGVSHPETGRAFVLLAEINRRKREAGRSEEALRSDLAAHEATYGPSHPEVGRTLTALGSLLRGECRAKEAEPLLLRALAIAEGAGGPSHPGVVAPLVELAETRWIELDDAGAERYLTRAIAILEPREASEHSQIQKLLGRLASMHWSRNDLKGARAIEERAFALAERWKAASKGDFFEAGMRLADTCTAIGDEAAAGSLYSRLNVLIRFRPGTPRSAAGRAPAAKEAGPRCPAKPSGSTTQNVSRVVAAMSPGLRGCYVQGLKKDPNTKGAVRITARIGAAGEVLRVTAPMAESTLPESVVKCAMDTVFGATFAPPEGGGATVVVPVTFMSIE